jgi:hypothetical protein
MIVVIDGVQLGRQIVPSDVPDWSVRTKYVTFRDYLAYCEDADHVRDGQPSPDDRCRRL